MKSLFVALKYLTLWGRLTPTQPTQKAIGSASLWFPIIGLALGLLLAIVNHLLAVHADSEILSIVLIMVLATATGGIHLEATRKTFDAFALEAKTASAQTITTFGLLAILFVVLFKIHAINIMDDRLLASLLLAPALARWTLITFIYGYHERCDELSRHIAENVSFWHLLAATAATLAIAVYFVGRKGLWIGLTLSLFALLLRSLLYGRRAVLSQDNFGAVIELSEALSLVLLATL